MHNAQVFGSMITSFNPNHVPATYLNPIASCKHLVNGASKNNLISNNYKYSFINGSVFDDHNLFIAMQVGSDHDC